MGSCWQGFISTQGCFIPQRCLCRSCLPLQILSPPAGLLNERPRTGLSGAGCCLSYTDGDQTSRAETCKTYKTKVRNVMLRACPPAGKGQTSVAALPRAVGQRLCEGLLGLSAGAWGCVLKSDILLASSKQFRLRFYLAVGSQLATD